MNNSIGANGISGQAFVICSGGTIQPNGYSIYNPILYKSKACDILYDFFGPNRNMLMIDEDYIEFTIKFGIVWLISNGKSSNYCQSHTPVRKQDFLNWASDPNPGTLYNTSVLSKEEVLKLLSDPKNE